MERNEKVYLSTQLLAVLPPIALKVAAYIANWQNSPNGIYLYEHLFARTLKMTEEEVRIAVQTLINLDLIGLVEVGDKTKIEINTCKWQQYYKIPLERVINHEGYKLAEEVTYTKQEKPTQDVEDMSEADLKRLLLRIEASLAERQEVKKITKTMEEADGLPF